MLLIRVGGIFARINNVKIANEYIIPDLSCFVKEIISLEVQYSTKVLLQQKLEPTLLIGNDI